MSAQHDRGNHDPERKPTRVLFICTGNIYRSRYAEAYLNHLAEQAEAPIQATSRGLAIHLVTESISPYALARMKEKGIARTLTGAGRQSLREEDLAQADIVIALKEAEHRPLLEQQFPQWADRVTYWHVSDLGEWDSRTALEAIEHKVEELFTRLRAKQA